MVQINKKLLEEIKASEYSEPIKEFLQRMLLFEFEHSEDPKVRFADRYNQEIKIYSMKLEVEQ